MVLLTVFINRRASLINMFKLNKNSLKTVFDIYEILRCIYKYYAMFIS